MTIGYKLNDLVKLVDTRFFCTKFLYKEEVKYGRVVGIKGCLCNVFGRPDPPRSHWFSCKGEYLCIRWVFANGESLVYDCHDSSITMLDEEEQALVILGCLGEES